MDRDSHELRAFSQSWPPGFLVSPAQLDAGARSRRRNALSLVSLALCAYCFGFAVTDWACDSRDKAAASSRAEADAVALHRKQSPAVTGARTTAPIAETVAITPEPARVAEQAKVVPRVTRGNSSPRVQKRTKPAAPPPLAELAAPLDEPTPAVSAEEVSTVLALADASKQIFASVDEAAPKPALVLPPPAAAVQRVPTTPRAQVVAIEAVAVEGGLPSKVVSRGVQRLLPHYDRCRELSDSAAQKLTLTTTIDEAGHGRHVTVEGLSQPSLRRCLEQATAHLVVPAPDTGTARAHWVVRFAAR